MRTTIDQAGRLVVPKSIREQLGITEGIVEVSIDGTAVRIEPVADDSVEAEGNWLVVPASGESLSAEQVRDLRDTGQR